MNSKIKDFLKHSSVELTFYTVFALVYFFSVLHWLGGWLYALSQHDKAGYAGVALAMIVGQGVLLEVLTTALLRLVRSRSRR